MASPAFNAKLFPADTIPYVAGADETAGELVKYGSIHLHANNTVLSGEPNNGCAVGIFTFPKATGVGTGANRGEPMYFSSGSVTGVAGDPDDLVGYLWPTDGAASVGDNDSTASVLLANG